MRIPPIPGLGLGRIVLAHLVAWLFRVANGAGIVGVLLGGGESMAGHASDYALAVPNGFRAIAHYVHGDRHVEELARTVRFINEEAPTPEEVRRTAAGTRSWLNRFDLARGSVLEGLGELADGEWVLGTADVRWGLTHMPPREQLDSLLVQAGEIVEPTLDYLSAVELDPLLRAAANASDNLAPDERVGTLTVMLVLGVLVWILGGFVSTVWIRRGMPSLVGRAWMRAGSRLFPTWYGEHGGEAARALGLTDSERPTAENSATV
ncbi:MAG: hypothetical protein HKO53_07015 [Gemmatimonadetes bacterium]|nr:hypothetical protein [Gemmatimonadota bacterium]